MEIHVSDSSTDICDTSLEIEFHRFNFSEAVYNELRVFISCKELFQQGELSYPEILLLYDDMYYRIKHAMHAHIIDQTDFSRLDKMLKEDL